MQGNVLPSSDVSNKGKTLQNIALCQRPDSVLLILPQASSCVQHQSYSIRSTFTKNVWKSGFFRQHLIISNKRERLSIRNADRSNGWIVPLIWKHFPTIFTTGLTTGANFLTPCTSTGPKMNCVGPIFLEGTKTKLHLVPHKTELSANYLLLWYKKFGSCTICKSIFGLQQNIWTTQDILGPVEGRGIIYNFVIFPQKSDYNRFFVY